MSGFVNSERLWCAFELELGLPVASCRAARLPADSVRRAAQRAHAASISPDPLNPNYSAQVGQSLYLISECLLLISSSHYQPLLSPTSDFAVTDSV